MQEAVEFLKKERSRAVDAILFARSRENSFCDLISKEDCVLFDYIGFAEFDYDVYFNNKTIVITCDLLLNHITSTGDVETAIAIVQEDILLRVLYPYQSTDPIANHEKLIENSVRQNLCNRLFELVEK